MFFLGNSKYFPSSIVANSRYKFRRNPSTAHALIYLQDKFMSVVDGNSFGLGVFMDLSKVFDIVDFIFIV